MGLIQFSWKVVGCIAIMSATFQCAAIANLHKLIKNLKFFHLVLQILSYRSNQKLIKNYHVGYLSELEYVWYFNFFLTIASNIWIPLNTPSCRKKSVEKISIYPVSFNPVCSIWIILVFLSINSIMVERRCFINCRWAVCWKHECK